MDISNIAQVGRIDVDAEALVGALCKSYILRAFADDHNKRLGSVIKRFDVRGPVYELHYEVYNHTKCDYDMLVQTLTNDQSQVIAAFEVVRKAIHEL